MKQLFVLVFAAAFLLACNTTKKESAETPMQFSERIVNTEVELGPKLAEAEKLIMAKLDSGNFQGAGEVAEDAERLVNDKINDIEAMRVKDFKGGDDFKTSAINYFEYVKSIYTNYKNIGKADNEGVRLAETRRMDTIRANQKNVITMMQAAQDKFAVDNGFQVDK